MILHMSWNAPECWWWLTIRGMRRQRLLVCRRFIEHMQYLCDYGAPKGVSLVIEPLTPMESPVITTADDCVDAIKAIEGIMWRP